jgi:hypothetical protein
MWQECNALTGQHLSNPYFNHSSFFLSSYRNYWVYILFISALMCLVGTCTCRDWKGIPSRILHYYAKPCPPNVTPDCNQAQDCRAQIELNYGIDPCRGQSRALCTWILVVVGSTWTPITCRMFTSHDPTFKRYIILLPTIADNANKSICILLWALYRVAKTSDL